MESKRKILNRHRGGEAIRSISRELNISRNTVRELIRSDDPPSTSYIRSLQPHLSLGPYIEFLEKLLRENKLAKPKRTIRHLFEELQLSGYAGSYSAVGRYAAKWGLDIQLCKFIHKPLNIALNSIVKFYQKVSHSFIPISNRHSPFCRDIVNCQVQCFEN